MPTKGLGIIQFAVTNCTSGGYLIILSINKCWFQMKEIEKKIFIPMLGHYETVSHTQVHINCTRRCHFDIMWYGYCAKISCFLRTCKIPLHCVNFQYTGKVATIHREYTAAFKLVIE